MQTKTANIVVISVVVVAIALLFVTIILAAVYGSQPQSQYIYIETDGDDNGGNGDDTENGEDNGGNGDDTENGGDNVQTARARARAKRFNADANNGNGVSEINTPDKVRDLMQNPAQPVAVMVYADWCGFCKKMQPVLEAVVEEGTTNGVQLYKINSNVAGDLLAEYAISGYPALLTNFGDNKYMGYRDGDGLKQILNAANRPKPGSKRMQVVSKPPKRMRLGPQKHKLQPKQPVRKNVTEEVTDENEVMQLLESNDTPVVAMVFAEWCGYCKKMAPILDQMLSDPAAKDVLIIKINADNAKKLGAKYQVSGFPVLLTNFGERKYVGFLDQQALRALLSQAAHLAEDKPNNRTNVRSHLQRIHAQQLQEHRRRNVQYR